MFYFKDNESKLSDKALDEFAEALAKHFKAGLGALRPAEAPPTTEHPVLGTVMHPNDAFRWLSLSVTVPSEIKVPMRQKMEAAGVTNQRDGDIVKRELGKRVAVTHPVLLSTVAARFGATIHDGKTPVIVPAKSPGKVLAVDFGIDRRKAALRDHLALFGEDFAHEVVEDASMPGDPAFETHEDLAAFVLDRWATTSLAETPAVKALPAGIVTEIMVEWLSNSQYDVAAANAVRDEG